MDDPMEQSHKHSALSRRLDALLEENWQAASEQPFGGFAQPEVSAQPEPEPIPEPPQPVAEPPELQEPSGPRPWQREGMLMLQSTLTILAVLMVVLTFCFRIASVRGESMEPTLYHGDFLLLRSNLLYTPERGDVVVLALTDYGEEPLIKRVIATAGDTVDIDFDAGVVYVNGTALEEPYILSPTHRDFGDKGVTFPQQVQPGCVFVLGDNRNNSDDSRCQAIGQVSCEAILGKALLILWPGNQDLDHLGMLAQ